MMKRAFTASIVAAAAAAVPILAPATASAESVVANYCNTLVQPYTSCPYVEYPANYFGGGGGDTLENVAEYNGSGTISICERVDADINGTWTTVSRDCADSPAVGSESLNAYVGYALRFYVGNNSAYAHTIVGQILD